MNPVCRKEYDKAKTLIKLRKDNMGTYTKPDIQNLDSGILLQFFENWEDTIKRYNGKDLLIKKRVFEVLNHEKIIDVNMYYADNFIIRDFELDYNILYINLDGSFNIICDDETIHIKPFSIAIFKKGSKIHIKNFDDVNYLITIRFESPLF